MVNYSPEILSIFAKASSPFERQENCWDYLEPEMNQAKFNSHIAKWQQVLSTQNGAERLQKYCTFEGIGQLELQQMLGEVQVNKQTILPDWLSTLASIKSIYEEHPSNMASDKLAYLDAEIRVPFEEILIPLVTLFLKKVEALIEPNKGLIDERVLVELERAFRWLLSKTAGKVLFETFYTFREIAMVANEHTKVTATSNGIYIDFVKKMLRGDFYKLLVDYPVLARIISVLTTNQIKVNARFINRFYDDYQSIQQQFFPNKNIGTLKAVKTSISDRHQDGEGVIILTFNSGDKLVYKPKNLDLAEQTNRFMAWINAQGFVPTFRKIQVLNKGKYGWTEFVPHLPCQSVSDVAIYYRRAGSLLGLHHFLKTTDCHFENVIANGAFPVVVDFETVLQPNVTPILGKNDSQADLVNFKKRRDTVQRTALLPFPMIKGNQDWSTGGFGGGAAPQPSKKLTCLHPNTDRMTIGVEQLEFDGEPNLPHLQKKAQRLTQYQEPFIEGFCHFYQFLMDKRDLLLSAQSPLKKFADLPERFLFRHTYVYSQILDKLLHPRYLKSGIDYGINLERLAKAFLKYAYKPKFWSLIYEERRAMMNQDIPYYTLTTTSTSLPIDKNHQLEDYFEQSSYQAMMDYLIAMSPNEMAAQVAIIQQTIQSILPKKTVLC
ncbi:MAG: type 2 lanthipeptide synthetase LanM [Bacteroidota bacterium]